MRATQYKSNTLWGITFASKSAAGKSNEIPAAQQLLAELAPEGCMIVADALNCQKETAEAVVKGKGDYLLVPKGNQAALEHEIRRELPVLQRI